MPSPCERAWLRSDGQNAQGRHAEGHSHLIKAPDPERIDSAPASLAPEEMDQPRACSPEPNFFPDTALQIGQTAEAQAAGSSPVLQLRHMLVLFVISHSV